MGECPGAFSVNGGRDFAAVLEETIRVVEQEAPDILPPAKGWTNSGCYMGDGWSVAWRVLDAQFWGVPQRRRRIALVADFGGGCAPEILFERESVSGNPEPCSTERKGTAGDAADGFGVYCLQGNGIDRSNNAGCAGRGWTDGNCYTLNTVDRPAVVFEPRTQDGTPRIHKSVIPTLNTAQGGQRQPCVCISGDIAGTLDSSYFKGTGNRNGEERTIVAFDQLRQGEFGDGRIGTTLTAHHEKEGRDLVCAVDCRNATESEINGTLQAKENGGTSLNLNNVVRQRYIVRRLTPLECTRLQGYPDGWVDIGDWVDSKGKKHKDADSPKYKALGNSIAIPPWLWVLSRLNEYCEEKTMASLFDGIAGFPLIWEFLNGKGSAVWCSEIEEFPIAVTKRRFPEDGT